MGGAHAHRHDHHQHGAEVEVPRGPRTLLLGVLALALVGTVVGLVLTWPDHHRVHELSSKVQFSAPGVTFPRAEIDDVQPVCGDNTDSSSCGALQVTVRDGESKGRHARVVVPPEVLESGLSPGDVVVLIRTPAQEGAPVAFGYFGAQRTFPVLVLLVLFVLVVALVARLRGVMALVGLAVSLAVIGWYMLPALLSGHSPVGVAVAGSAAIMFVVLYTAHGWSLRTSAALAGTLAGIGLTAAIGELSVRGTHLTGVTDEGSRILSAAAGDLSFRGLFTCALIVAGLGVLNDVTITQASAVWEIRAASPTMSRRRVFTSAMRIGRDHIASTIYTIVFAFAGTGLAVLLLLHLYDRPLLDLLATEEIGEEAVRTLATAIGLVLSVPATTAIATATLPPGDDERR